MTTRQPEPASSPESQHLLRQRLFVALVEQRVLDSRKYGEALYAPVTWEDVDRTLADVRTPPGQV